MAKKNNEYLDIEAMRMGYEMMLQEATHQLEAGMHTDSIRTLLIDRQAHITKRLEELK